MIAINAVTAQICPACGHGGARTLYQRRLQDKLWSLARCRRCRQHFTLPIPSEADLESFYAGDYHSELRCEGGSEAAFAEKYQRYARMLGRHLTGGRVVDVGCSTGLLVKMLRERGYDAQGVELNRQSAEWGSAHYQITIHANPLEQCGFAAGSLDAILLTDVLEHTRHPRDFLRNAARLLRSGGFALVTFPDIRSAESRYQFFLSKLLHRGWIWRSCHIPLHVWEFTGQTASACFAGAGFRIVEFRRSQLPPETDAPIAVRLLDVPARWIGWPPFDRWLGSQMEFVIQKTGA